jgi:hypothetical protein
MNEISIQFVGEEQTFKGFSDLHKKLYRLRQAGTEDPVHLEYRLLSRQAGCVDLCF